MSLYTLSLDGKVAWSHQGPRAGALNGLGSLGARPRAPIAALN